MITFLALYSPKACPDHVYLRMCILYVQGLTGGTDQTSGECFLGQTIPI